MTVQLTETERRVMAVALARYANGVTGLEGQEAATLAELIAKATGVAVTVREAGRTE